MDIEDIYNIRYFDIQWPQSITVIFSISQSQIPSFLSSPKLSTFDMNKSNSRREKTATYRPLFRTDKILKIGTVAIWTVTSGYTNKYLLFVVWKMILRMLGARMVKYMCCYEWIDIKYWFRVGLHLVWCFGLYFRQYIHKYWHTLTQRSQFCSSFHLKFTE